MGGAGRNLAPWDPVVIGAHAATLSLAGDDAGAAALLGTLGDGSAFGAPIGLAVHHLLRGDVDRGGRLDRHARSSSVIPASCSSSTYRRSAAREPALAGGSRR